LASAALKIDKRAFSGRDMRPGRFPFDVSECCDAGGGAAGASRITLKAEFNVLNRKSARNNKEQSHDERG
jgi:hypothetical protein